jgi:predicted dehydrogenase
MAARTRTGGGAADPAAIGTHGHRRQYEEFASALAERRAPSVDAVEARKAVAIILAVHRSARSGKTRAPGRRGLSRRVGPTPPPIPG